MCTAAVTVAMVLAASPAFAQLGGKLGKVGDAVKKGKDAKDAMEVTPAEEQEIGAKVSAMLREKYGVVQDPAIHKYVTLTGTVLAAASSRPTLPWKFIVLDTDGVNAFAAPGGFVHITRGALALIKNESELAGVLGHEIGHVVEKHTLNAIKKGNMVSLGAEAARSEVVTKVANKAYEVVLENKFDRGDEMAADTDGIKLANAAGYAPNGLSGFLTRLAERNKDLKDRSGLFASHPETKARLDGIAKNIAGEKLAATALVAARYTSSVPFRSGPPAAGAAPASGKPADSGSKFGLGGLTGVGKEKSSGQTVSSAGSRGVNPDRDAIGGPNKGAVVVTVSAAEVAAFKKGIAG
jgi:predicted Zn-dependent protease